LPIWLTDTVRPAMVGIAALLALSCAVVAASLVVHWGTMHQLFGITDSFFGQLSLTLMSLLYLPNVVVGAAAIAVGSSAHIGFATFSAFTVFGGDIPALPILAAAPTPPLGPVWVALLIIGAAAGVVIGQQCARRPLPLPTAFAKLAAAALLAAVSLALLGGAAGGELGNFGHVGVDQLTFAPGAFLCFFVIGGLTVVMAGGISPRPRQVVRPVEAAPVPTDEQSEPMTEPLALGDERAATAENDEQSGPERTLDESEPESESDSGSEADPEPEPEPQPEPGPPPPPVKPAPDAEDVEDLMFVDDDIETSRRSRRPQPPAGTG
jgi:hypothetical protein